MPHREDRSWSEASLVLVRVSVAALGVQAPISPSCGHPGVAGLVSHGAHARGRWLTLLQAVDVTALLQPEQRSAVRGVMALAAHDTAPTQAGPIVVMGREHLGPWCWVCLLG